MTLRSGLKGNEFLEYFSKVPIVQTLFNGVFAINKLPRTLAFRHFFICNLSPADHPGSHWLAVIRSHKDSIEVFNSLGYENLDSLMPHLKFRKKFEIHFNNQQLQSNISLNCGLFCIYFILHRALNFDLSFTDLLEQIFQTDLNTNEIKVTSFCSNILLHGDEALFI
jgi:hypothetical protein